MVAFGLSSVNMPHGLAGDMDGYFVWQRALEFNQYGYRPSRSWGFPAYELVVYPLISHAGVAWAKVYSQLCYVAACLVFLATARLVTPSASAAVLATVGFASLPIAIISGNTLLDTSQGLLLGIAAIRFYLAWAQDGRPRDFYLLCLILGVATSTRPDYVLLSMAVLGVVVVRKRPSMPMMAGGLVLWIVSTVAPYAIYGSVPLNVQTYLPDPIWQKLVQAAGGSVALLGLPASVVLLVWGWRMRRPLPVLWQQTKTDDVMALFACAVVLYGMRFLLLPDELEYIGILVPLLILLVLRAGASVPAIALLALALAVPNVVQVHFAKRDVQGRLRPAVGVSPGVIVQDRRARERLEYVHTRLPNLMGSLARANGCGEYATMPTGDEGRCVIIPNDQLRFYNNARHGGRYFRAGCTQKIFSYPMPSHRGWRQLIGFDDWRALTREELEPVILPYCTDNPPQG